MIAIFLAPVYLVVNLYVLIRSMKWLKICHGFFHNRIFQRVFYGVYIFQATSLLWAFLLPVGKLQRLIKIISNYWLGIFLYTLLFIAISDLVLLLFKYLGKRHRTSCEGRLFLATLGGIVFFSVVAMSVYGIVHGNIIQVAKYDIKIDKPLTTQVEESANMEPSLKKDPSMKVVLVADLHLGYSVGTPMMQQMVKKINREKPDLVCFAGDIFDNEYEAVGNSEKIIELLKGIKSTYGVYAVFGNHDIQEPILAGFTFGNKKSKTNDPRMLEFMKRANITLLQDAYVQLPNGVYVIGRRDEERPGDNLSKRAEIKGLLAGLDKLKPIIVLDHQPRELEKLAQAGVDLDLSGHTHAGQIFPANLFIHFFWKNAWGYKKIQQMSSLVTSGIGVYGPDMRTFTDSELMSVQLRFQS